MFATRHGCQIEVFSRKYIGFFCGLDVAAVGFFHLYPRTHSRSEKHTLALDVCCRIPVLITFAALSHSFAVVVLTYPLICWQNAETA